VKSLVALLVFLPLKHQLPPSSSNESFFISFYTSCKLTCSGSRFRPSATNVVYTNFILSNIASKSSIVLTILRVISGSIGPSIIESSNFTAFYLSSSIIPALSPDIPLSLSSLSVAP
jgi:hypothetical protein